MSVLLLRFLNVGVLRNLNFTPMTPERHRGGYFDVKYEGCWPGGSVPIGRAGHFYNSVNRHSDTLMIVSQRLVKSRCET